MNVISTKHKIYLALAIWLALVGVMFSYIFPLLGQSNAAQLNTLGDQRKQLGKLQAEQESFQQAQADLLAVAKKPRQPEDFFSKDITLVNEIQALEDLGAKSGVQFALSGVAGTIATVPKAKTASEIFAVPAVLSISGPFSGVASFIESLENLDFIVNVSGISVTSVGADKIAATLTANFYLHK